MTATTLGQRIRDARIAAHLTAKQLAESLGVTTQTVCAWERGEKCPRFHRLVELAGPLFTTTAHLIGEETPTPVSATPAPPIPLSFAAIADDLRQRATALREEARERQMESQRYKTQNLATALEDAAKLLDDAHVAMRQITPSTVRSAARLDDPIPVVKMPDKTIFAKASQYDTSNDLTKLSGYMSEVHT